MPANISDGFNRVTPNFITEFMKLFRGKIPNIFGGFNIG
ncbi:uncharacterized protein METZ01_LOCUS81303 [marine metagenome]|uniref:Uncharacterized protein n=1 Tax=marine metagenome TaxID=408172 RepID=A0A381UJX6_9ZZZZ